MRVVTDRVWQRRGFHSLWRPVPGASPDDGAGTAGSHLMALLVQAMSDGPEATKAAGHRYSFSACDPPQPTETRA